MSNTMWIGLGILVGIYILYKLLFRTSRSDDDYQKVYNEVLTSDKCKVKGQYDK